MRKISFAVVDRSIKVLPSLCALILLLVQGSLSAEESPIQITWQRVGNYDVLRLNGVDLEPRPNDTVQSIVVRAEAILPADITPRTPVKVIIPSEWVFNSGFADQGILPNLYGFSANIFQSLTAATREVTYIHKGRKLRRYVIKISNKDCVRSDAEHAKYWLDGEYFGTWDEAENKFAEFAWSEGAVAELCFDLNPWGDDDLLLIGGITEELQKIFEAHKISTKTYKSFRRREDR